VIRFYLLVRQELGPHGTSICLHGTEWCLDRSDGLFIQFTELPLAVSKLCNVSINLSTGMNEVSRDGFTINMVVLDEIQKVVKHEN